MDIAKQINENKIKFEKVNIELYEIIKGKAENLIDWKVLYYILKRKFNLSIKDAEELVTLQFKEYNKWIEENKY